MTIDLTMFAMIVSLAAAIITVIGFAASIWFFMAGSRLQRDAQDAISRIESLAQAINDRTGEQFSTLIEAVAGAKEEVSEIIDPGSPNSEKVDAAFAELRGEIQSLAARQVVSTPRLVISGKDPKVIVRPASVNPNQFRAWLKKDRGAKQERDAQIQTIIDTMREVGPLTSAELGQLSPYAIQELEESGLIDFGDDNKWRVRNQTD